MKSTEPMESRLKRVDMHEYFLGKIKDAMESNNFIEASWLIYSCLENRYFRTLEKYKADCKFCRSKSKCNKKPKNELALATKIKCVRRLYENGVECITGAFSVSLFRETLKWIDERNDLMHDLLALDTYLESDLKFEKSAHDGVKLLTDTYDCCKKFRALFYQDGYQFIFPEAAMEGCPCKPRKQEDV